MTDRDRHLDRLAKLLALESSPNVHEADSARRAAESFMRRHGLRREEASGRTASGYYEHPMGARGWKQAWRFALVTAAARHCGAEAIGLWDGDRLKVRVAGVRSDVERAVVLYDQLLALVIELGRDVSPADLDLGMLAELEDHGARECSDAFRRGVVLGIIVHLARLSGEPLFRDHHVPPAQERSGEAARDQVSLARTDRGRRGQSDRVRARYEPDERELDLDVVSALAWFGAGLRVAGERVVVAGDGSAHSRPVVVGERREFVVPEEGREILRRWAAMPVMMVAGRTPQDHIDAYWRKLASEMGFDADTVEVIPGTPRFTAVVVERGESERAKGGSRG